MKISDTPLFQNNPFILPTPPIFWKKLEPSPPPSPPFLQKFQKLNIKGRGGVQLCTMLIINETEIHQIF